MLQSTEDQRVTAPSRLYLQAFVASTGTAHLLSANQHREHEGIIRADRTEVLWSGRSQPSAESCRATVVAGACRLVRRVAPVPRRPVLSFSCQLAHGTTRATVAPLGWSCQRLSAHRRAARLNPQQKRTTHVKGARAPADERLGRACPLTRSVGQGGGPASRKGSRAPHPACQSRS